MHVFFKFEKKKLFLKKTYLLVVIPNYLLFFSIYNIQSLLNFIKNVS